MEPTITEVQLYDWLLENNVDEFYSINPYAHSLRFFYAEPGSDDGHFIYFKLEADAFARLEQRTPSPFPNSNNLYDADLGNLKEFLTPSSRLAKLRVLLDG